MPWVHGTSVSCDPVQFFGLTTANELAPALHRLLVMIVACTATIKNHQYAAVSSK